MTVTPDAVTPADRADDRRVTLLTFGIVLGIFAVGVSVQSVFVLGILPRSMMGSDPVTLINLVVRLVANGSAVAVGLLGVALLNPQERGIPGRLGTGFAIAFGAALARAAVQIGIGIYAPGDGIEVSAEVVTATIAGSISLTIALAQTDARRRLRTGERASAQQALRSAAALEALQSEELRMRRELADGLHGTVQQRFVLLSARITALIEADRRGGEGEPSGSRRRAEGSDDDPDRSATAELAAIRADLDDLREQDLRAMSRLLYPAELDRGAVPAIRALFQPLPSTIAFVLDFSDDVLALEAHGNRMLSPERRLLLVRIVEESLSNALKHGHATELRVRLDHRDSAFEVVIDDDGTGLIEPVELSGIRNLRHQLDLVGGRIDLGPGPSGLGARVSAVVPDGRA
ncbi:MAG: hypothetical protein EPO52_06845 [Herbiconiux sp.]|uniref:sensor histidine kinase n=1 Tax=Herbiconiux sp. TaxID=1871186 RepID=UPI0011F595BC|nr:ATP-binding protein [Herbiconiux sp.]TAJ47904.1 MAG: hypothetical protein EPO52_06845 [Herbiconiux sp.]